ncbi:MAG: geranylgeranylglycerol-phosphate geranylgeranyltransferase [Urechidicola sp.]|nr:geranylgeranylglycerol-phosphate geranylgeranyltransferase [Urechidicola sp.]
MSNVTTIKQYGLKIFSLFSIVRGYNILALVIAQYLAALFIFSPDKSLRTVLLDTNLFFIVLASVCVVASGYIINNFYDKEKDQINRPVKSKIDAYVSQKTKLTIYFLLNFIGVLLSYLVSWKAAFFFAVYIFLIWFYSHKLKKYSIIGLISATILTILPFFAVFVYYKNFSNIIFVHAVFLFLLLLIRELMKNLENMDGDILVNNQTVAVKYGEVFIKKFSTFLLLLILIPIYFLWQYPEIGWMKYYFYAAGLSLLIFIFLLWNSNTKQRYIILHNLLKLLIFAGIFSLMLIDTSVIIERLINKI